MDAEDGKITLVRFVHEARKQIIAVRNGLKKLLGDD